MARPYWKFNYLNSKIYKNIFVSQIFPTKLTRFFCRSSTIPRCFFKKIALLYKGEFYTKAVFTKHTIGYKLGEFNVTRKPFSFPPKKKKK